MQNGENTKEDKYIGSYHPYPKEEPTWSTEDKINYLRKNLPRKHIKKKDKNILSMFFNSIRKKKSY